MLWRFSATATREDIDCNRKGSTVKAKSVPEDEEFHIHVLQNGARMLELIGQRFILYSQQKDGHV
jgi:hypothetical protein